MAKHNSNSRKSNLTINNEGHVAFKMKDKEKLVTQVLTSFFNEKKFYSDNTSDMLKLATYISTKDPQFISNLARYARKECHLRSVSHALACIIAHSVETKPFINVTIDDIVERPDDILEVLACYLNMFGKPIPNGLKKALANKLTQFNQYQISKYNSKNRKLKFKDVVQLVHPKPNSEKENELIKAILNDTLPIAKRWETELSIKGNTKEVWENLIEENQVGYMAMLRNLNNILNANPNNIEKCYQKLCDKEEVLKSKQLPFRYLAAYNSLIGNPYSTNKVFDTLEKAIKCSAENLQKIKGKTVIAIDVSYSMKANKISSNSKLKCSDIACLLGIIASYLCEEFVVYTFDTKINKLNISSHSNIIQTSKHIDVNGGATFLDLVLKEMIEKTIVADRLIILSDNVINSSYKRTCQSLADEYRKNINPDLWVHAIDLQGYGTQQFMGSKTNIVAGWNERILEFIPTVEKGLDSQVKAIENYHLKQ